MNIERTSLVCKALGYPKRMAILRLLKKHQSLSVSEISQKISLSIPVTTKHIQTLKNAKIITGRRRGMYMMYRINLHQPFPADQVIKKL